MKKILFAICLLASAGLLTAAAGNISRRRSAPRVVKAAVLDRDAIFARDPVASRLRSMRDMRSRMLRGMSDASFKPGGVTTADVLRNERTLLSGGFRGHGGAYSAIATRRAGEKLQTEIGAARDEFDAQTEKEYHETVSRLDGIFNRRQPAASDEQRGRKTKLFALSLQLDTLTNDRITSTWNNFGAMRDELESVKGEASAEDARSRDAFTRSQLADAADARAEFAETRKSAGVELDARLKQLLDDERARTSAEIKTYEDKLSLAESRAADKRRELAGAMARSAAANPPAGAEGADNLSAALAKYERSFDELLRRRIAAAATDGALDVVIDKPLYKSKQVVDLTGRF